MKNKIISKIYLLAFLILLPFTAQAQTLDNPISATSVDQLVVNITQGMLALLGSAAFLVFIYGGVLFLTSGGNQERVKKGKTILIWAILGIVLIFASYAILQYIFTALGGAPTE